MWPIFGYADHFSAKKIVKILINETRFLAFFFGQPSKQFQNSVFYLHESKFENKYFIKVSNLIEPGVDVMIPIFCELGQFSAKKLALFSKTNTMINFFSNFSFVLIQKRQFFAKFFGEKYLKNYSIGP
jgi:uncharacterized membrane protein YkgB